MEPGTRLGPYEIKAPLGAGGMGEVYLAEDTRLGRQVAVKVLPPEFAADPERLARFEQEARASAALNHPHIAVVHDVGHEGNVHFMVQELLEGQTLRDRMEQGRLPLLEALTLSREIAEGLGAAHGAGITHRDLKPENVFITEDGHAKVLDFGLAKLIEPTTSGAGGSATMSPTVLGTVAGQIMGTAGYMAPEQVDGGEVDHRADIFAFGCLLYELAAGQQPFRGKNMIETLNRITNIEPDGLETIDGGLPAELQRILDKCLAKNPGARYQSARDLAVDLRGLSTSVETGRAVPLSDATAESTTTRGVSAAAVAAIAIAALAVGSIATWWLNDAGGAPTRLRRSSVFLREGLGRYAPWTTITISPDGSRIAYMSQGDPTSTTGGSPVWLRAVDQLEGIQLTESRGLGAFSPDGRWLAFRGVEDDLLKMPISGGAPQTIVAEIDGLRGLSWGRTGNIVYAPRSGRDGLFEVSANGGEPRRLTTPEGGSHRSPYYLPNGEGVIYTSVTSGGGHAIEYLDLSSGESKRVRENAGSGRYLPTGHLVWVTGNALYAATFDVDRKELSGTAVPVAEHVFADAIGTASYSFAEDGTLVYLRGELSDDSNSEIGWFGEDDALVDGSSQMEPQLSPDGTQFAYTVYGDNGSSLWTLDLRGGVPTRLTFDRGEVTGPEWSGDGSQINFNFWPTIAPADDAGSAGPNQVMRVAADGSSPPLVVPDTDGYELSAIAADGSFFVGHDRSPETDSGLFVVPLTGDGSPEPLAASPAREAWAAVSPDSRWIAYAGDPDGEWSVYVRAWPNTGTVRQIPYAGSAGHPRWSADGRTLYFRTNVGVMATPVVARGAALTFGAPSVVAAGFGGIFAGRNRGGVWSKDYDVTPDGRVILLRSAGEEDEADTGHAVIVQGWFDEVSRLIDEAQQ